MHFRFACAIIYKLSERTADAPLAQLDRVFDYESKGRGFESRRAHQTKSHPLRVAFRLAIEPTGIRTHKQETE